MSTSADPSSPSSAASPTPPPLPAYAARKTPPPIPARRWRMPTTRILNNTAVIVGGLVLASLVGWRLSRVQQESDREALAEKIAAQELTGDDPKVLYRMSKQIDGMTPRPLNDSITVRQIFPNRPKELRYQIRLERVLQAGIKPNAYFYAAQRGLQAAVAADEIAEPVLRKAPAIFVDVYDQYDAFLFSYNWKPADLYGE